MKAAAEGGVYGVYPVGTGDEDAGVILDLLEELGYL